MRRKQNRRALDLKELATGKAREPKSAYGLLAYLVNAIKTAPGGVYPLGHEDCHWNAAAYPAQFMAASGYLMDGDPADEEAALHCLTALAHKIDCETLMGTPLICDGQEWLPGAYHLAHAYVRERAERSYRDRTLEQAQVISAAKRLFNATEALAS